jgi:hypothetical protein
MFRQPRCASLSVPELLRGKLSFGAMMEQRGYPCVPSPSEPSPQPYVRTPRSSHVRSISATTVTVAPPHAAAAPGLAALSIESYGDGEAAGPDSMPGPAPAAPPALEPSVEENVYFSGGFTTRRYSVGGQGVAGFRPEQAAATQLETPIDVRHTPALQRSFAQAVSGAIAEFMLTHYGLDP